jgi:predicted enzyme related to lactoylglutathione lyase
MSDGEGAAGGGVTGLGGVFFRARDPDGLKAWYERVLGVPAEDLFMVGRFGWATDPEGNRLELWQPAEGM